MKKKIIISIIVVLVIVVAIIANNKPEENPNGKPVVKIGVSLPLTGNQAYLGQSAKNAIDLALKEVRKPLNKYEYKVIYENNEFSSKGVNNNLNKFIFLDKVNALMTYFSQAGQIANPLATEHKIIHMANTWEEPVKEGKYNFVQATTRKTVSDKFVYFLKTKENIKNIAVITSTRAGSQLTAEVLADDLKKEGYNVLFNAYTRGEREFSTLVDKIYLNDIDLYVIVALPPELNMLIKELYIKGVSSKITGVGGFDAVDLKNTSGFDGIEYVSYGREKDSYVNAYIKAYNSYPPTFANVSYDQLKLLVKAFESNYIENGIPSSDVIAEYILGLEEFNCSTKCKIDKTGLISSPASIKRFKDNAYEYLEEK